MFYILKSEKANKYYFGSTINLEKRLKKHIYDFKRSKHHNVFAQEIWDKYKDWSINAFIPFENFTEAKKFEEKMINKYKGCNWLVNIGLGVKGGDNVTLNPNKNDIVLRRSQTLKDNILEIKNKNPEMFYQKFVAPMLGEKNPMYGKTHTLEIRKRLSELKKGKSPPNKGMAMSEEQKKKLSLVCPKKFGPDNQFYGKTHTEKTKQILREKQLGKVTGLGDIIEIDGIQYPSYWNASKILNIPLVTIRWRCLSKNPKFKNYKLISKSPTTNKSTLMECKSGSE